MNTKVLESGALSGDSFDQFNTEIQDAALKVTKQTLAIPQDVAFHRSMDSSLAQNFDAFSARVLDVMNRLLALASTVDGAESRKGKAKAKLENQDDVTDNFQSVIVDSMDSLLERTDACLDEFLGKKKPPAIAINLPKPTAPKRANATKGGLDPALQHASYLRKPQLDFKTKADNMYTSPWLPTLSHKYNAQVPLGHEYRDNDSLPSGNYHPYRYEIKHTSYPSRMFRSTSPIPPKSFENTPFTFVSTQAQFSSMLEELRLCKELALDLEHHSYRSFAGFLCLMQISTREEDWVVDLLALREEVAELNEVFTNPSIIKVLHGADSDIVWLQQDFSLYIVNLFDTYHASKILEFPRHGLANLLEMYCDFIADKRYQLADWRIRPLPEEMLHYARSDTHFLLYIYDNLRNALLDRAQSRASSPPDGDVVPNSSRLRPGQDPAHALVREVLNRSEDTALRRYEREMYDLEDGTGPGGWDTMAKKWNKSLLTKAAGSAGGVQKDVYRAMHAWRDRVARMEDESTRYVLPNHYVFQLAEKPPADMAQLIAMYKYMPPVVRQRARELLDVISDAVKGYADGSVANPDVMAVEIPVSNGDSPVATAPTVPEVDTVWSKVSEAHAIATPSSSLFGQTLASQGAADPTPLTSATSTLFGTTLLTSATSPQTASLQFKNIVARIHSSLVVAPTAPKIVSGSVTVMEQINSANTLATATSSDTEAPNAGTGMIEIPYIPASNRQTTQIAEDTIIVVGQRQVKKRKRTKNTTPDVSETAEGTSATKRHKSPSEDDVSECFDYSAVPNILDDLPEPERVDAKPGKGKKKKGPKEMKKIEYGNFGAPPKVYREPKSGNLSRTFK